MEAISFHVVPAVDALTAKFEEAVAAQGIPLACWDRGSQWGPALLVVRRLDDDSIKAIAQRVADRSRRVLVACITSEQVTSEQIWHLLELGADDALICSDDCDCIVDVAARLRRWSEVEILVHSPYVKKLAIGHSIVWLQTLRTMIEAAKFSRVPILLTGETGTGKEVAADLINWIDNGEQTKRPTLVDCASITPSLSGSEFFGHERGAFTGAATSRDGAFALADGGVLFLDEVGELPAELQAQLLRVLQEGTYRRVGGNTWRRTSFRLIAATNRNLVEDVENGRFRRDLYYRIASTVISLPALRNRTEDILLLARTFLREYLREDEQPKLDDCMRTYLLERDYPGNVRDLKQLCTRMATAHGGSTLFTAGDVPFDERPPCASGNDWRGDGFDMAIERAVELGLGLAEIKEAAADATIAHATHRFGGNLTQAAEWLNVTPRTLQLRRRKAQTASRS